MPTPRHLKSIATLADLRTTRAIQWATRTAKTPSSIRRTAALLVSTVAALATAGGGWAATIYSDFGTTPPTFNQALGVCAAEG
jgi:hypothetical protein